MFRLPSAALPAVSTSSPELYRAALEGAFQRAADAYDTDARVP